MLGPILGGFLLSISLPIHLNFIAFAIPGLIAAIALAIVPEKQAHYNKVANEMNSDSEQQKVM
jgi:MFS transporter, AAHS family, benzoate transport protein